MLTKRSDTDGATTMTVSERSYASGPSDLPLIGRTIGEDLERTVVCQSEHEALVDVPARRRWSYKQLDEAVDRVATALLQLGIAKGDRVGIWSPNCAEWVFVQYATAKVGAVLVNINPAYRSHELEYVLNQAGVRLLIAAPSFKTSDYSAMITQVRDRCAVLEDVVLLGSERWSGIASCDVDGAALAARAATLRFDDPINIQYTSGTTGFPKGATLSHHNILNNGFFVGNLLGYTDADRVCVPVPFYHCFGMVMGNLGATSNGATIVIPAPAFDPGATMQAVQDERCTSLYGVPTMFIAELGLPDFPGYDLSSLRTGIMAGAPCPVELMKRVVSEMHMTEVTIMYGMTETSPVSTMTRRSDDIEHRVSTVGTVMPHVEVQIVDPDTGLTAPRGTAGELCTRGYSVMLGYWDAPEQTAQAVDAAGWMHTGDLASMDDDGYVAIVGRIKDMVLRGGENIYPREVEEFLYRHPAIADVQVIGVPDDKYGEELMAWVCVNPGASLTIDELRSFCDGQLAHYKIPRYLHLCDEFPMTVTGKVRKVEMRERAVEILGLGVDQRE
jgi:fatty-acyl-CoA synthase